MFGRNPVRKIDLSNGNFLKLQGKPWLTIQGEGPYAGMPATFIRLWGCHLQCYFCDTDFESDAREWSLEALILACRPDVSLVVLTGGEPMRQNIAPLCEKLMRLGHLVQIETAGSFWFQPHENFLMPEIVVSPKTPTVHAQIAEHAMAWKYIISVNQNLDPIDELPVMDTQKGLHLRKLARPREGIPSAHIYVQPMDEHDPITNAKNVALCVEIAQTKGYTVSLQQHKILGVA